MTYALLPMPYRYSSVRKKIDDPRCALNPFTRPCHLPFLAAHLTHALLLVPSTQPHLPRHLTHPRLTHPLHSPSLTHSTHLTHPLHSPSLTHSTRLTHPLHSDPPSPCRYSSWFVKFKGFSDSPYPGERQWRWWGREVGGVSESEGMSEGEGMSQDEGVRQGVRLNRHLFGIWINVLLR